MRAILLIGVGILLAASPGQAQAYLQGGNPQPLPKLIRLLKQRDFHAVTWVFAIRQMGPAAREARPALLAALAEEGRDSFFRSNCVQALALTGPPEEVILAALRKVCLDDTDFEVRVYAAAALVRFDPAISQELLQILADGLRNEDTQSRLTAIASLEVLALPNSAAAKVLTPLLLNHLHDSDMHIRSGAATALRKLAPTAPETMSALVAALQDPNESVRWWAAGDCRELGAAAVVATPQLANLLRDSSEHNRRAAAEALAKIGPGAQAAVPELIALLADQQARYAAMDALAKIGPAAVPALILKLNSETTQERINVCGALATFGSAASDAVPKLLAMARDDDPLIREAVIRALGSVHGENAADVRATLSAAIVDTDADVRLAAAASFIAVGQMPPKAIRLLLAARYTTRGTWFSAGMLLQSIKVAELPAAVEFLHDNDPQVRESAFWLIGHMGEDDPERAGSAILQAMIDPAGKFQGAAVGALTPLVAKHSGLLQHVLARRHDPNPDVRQGIAHVLGAVGQEDGEPAAEALLELLADPHAHTAAWRALVRLGSHSHTAVDSLLAALDDADEPMRCKIIDTLGKINAPPDERPGLADFYVRFANASDKLGKTSEKIIPALCRALDDPAESVSESAVQWLAAIRPPPGIYELVESLRSPKATVREAAAKALSEWGPKAAEAIPALVTALADQDPSVQQAAAIALVHVGRGSNFAAGALAKAIALEPDDFDAFEDDAAHLLQTLAINSELRDADIDDTFAGQLLPVLLRKLQSREADAASEAQSVLIDLGLQAPQVMNALQDVAKRSRGGARVLAKEAIETIDAELVLQRDGLSEELAALRKSSGEHRTRIIASLSLTSLPTDEVVSALTTALAEPRNDNKEEAEACAALATALVEIQGPTEEVMASIARLLKASHPLVRRTAAELLGSFGPKSHEYAPDLVATAGDADTFVQRAAVTALGQIGPVAKTAAAPLWRDVFTEFDDELVNCAAIALSQIDPASADEAVPILLEGFTPNLPTAKIRSRAEALGRIGPKARPALPTLLWFWQRTASYQVHAALADAIYAIDPDAAQAAGVR